MSLAKTFLIGLLLSPTLALYGVDAADQLSRLPRTNLLVYHNRKGDIAPAKSKADWQKRRSEIIQGMQEIMGPLPGREKRCPLEMKIESEVDSGSYVRRFITYASEPGSRVPAFLLVPKRALSGRVRLPAILALHPTDMEYGHRVVIESLRGYYSIYGNDLAER